MISPEQPREFTRKDREFMQSIGSTQTPGRLRSVDDFYESYHQYGSLAELQEAWPKFFEDPGVAFDKKYTKNFYHKERKKRKLLERVEELKKRRKTNIQNSYYVDFPVKPSVRPLGMNDVFYFNVHSNDKTPGYQLGQIIGVSNFSEEDVLKIVNLPRLGLNGGIQALADALNLPVNTLHRYVSQVYTPRGSR